MADDTEGKYFVFIYIYNYNLSEGCRKYRLNLVRKGDIERRTLQNLRRSAGMATVLNNALQTIQSHRDLSPHYAELLDILEEILILREEYRRRIQREIFPVHEKMIAAKMMGGFPLVDFSSVIQDLAEPQAYFLALLEIAERRAPGETGEMARKIRDGEIRFNDLIHESFNPPPFEDEEALRDEEEAAVRKADWVEGYCPVCGREPKIGEIRDEEGSRYLFCNQCGFDWSYLRIKCPFCGNEEQQSLAYFTIEGDERYRVDVCNECKRYIKIVDFREAKRKADLDVEDIATLHLDMLANDEGYD
jgi:FdhE protein